MGDYITTYSKVHFRIMDPEPEDIRIEDIAHALSMMTRANGHFPEFYSVAQHSISCVKEAKTRNYDNRVILGCLLHDASEAYLSDLTRPVKKNMTMYLQVEEQLQGLIYERFLGTPLSRQEEKLIKTVDDAELYYEFDHFMGEKLFKEPPVLVHTPDYTLRPMKEVEEEFLALYRGIVEA